MRSLISRLEFQVRHLSARSVQAFMWISDTSIKRPVFATMVIVSFMVLGLVSMTRLGIDLFPEVNFPFVNITTRLSRRGAGRSRDARHAADRGRRRRHQRRQAGPVSLDRGRLARRLELRLEVDPQAAAGEVREKVAAIRGGCRRTSRIRRSCASTSRRCRS